MNRRLQLLSFFCLVAVAAVPTVPAAEPGQIVQEAVRQERISEDMAAIVADLQAMMADAASNEVLSECGGDALREIAGTVGEIDQQHVRAAIGCLRTAGREPGQGRAQIAAAQGHIKTAADRMSTLLRKFNALRAEERIAAEIQETIEIQEEVTQRSAQVGRELLEGKQPSTEPGELAKQQEKAARRAAALQDFLRDCLRDELTPASRGRLERGFQHLTQKQTPARLNDAANDLRKEDVIPAVGKQKAALADLKELADIVSNEQRLAALPSEANSDARREETEKLLGEQKQLRERIEQMEPSEFNNASLDAQVAQLNLAQRAEEMSPSPPPRAEEKPPSPPPGAETKPPGPPPSAAEKPPVPQPPPEATAKSKRKGQGSGEGEKPKPFPMAGKSNQGPSAEMKKAADALAQQQQAAAVAAMQAAEAKLAAALPAAQGQAQSGQGRGRGEMGRGQQGMGEKGDAKLAGRGKPGGRGRTPGQGAQGPFSPGNVAGELPEETRSTWQSLSQRERRAVSENFARELPQEYREMIKAYYEFLSKQ